MAISKLVDYEATATHELLGPDGKGLGIKFTVRSFLCQEAKVIGRKIQAQMRSLDASKDVSPAAFEKNQEVLEGLLVDRLVACLGSIDWGDEEWEVGGGPLPDTKKGKKTFCGTEWIFPQVNKAVEAMGDFTKA